MVDKVIRAKAEKFANRIGSPQVVPTQGKSVRYADWDTEPPSKPGHWYYADGCGIRLDNHTVVDVDDIAKAERTRVFLGISEGDTLEVATARGVHIYFKGTVEPYAILRKKLADGKHEPGIEVKSGNGHQCLAPGPPGKEIAHKVPLLPVPKHLTQELHQDIEDLYQLPETHRSDDGRGNWWKTLAAYRGHYGQTPYNSVVRRCLKHWSKGGSGYAAADWKEGGKYDERSDHYKEHKNNYTIHNTRKAAHQERGTDLDSKLAKQRKPGSVEADGEETYLISLAEVAAQPPITYEPILKDHEDNLVIPHGTVTCLYGYGESGKSMVTTALVHQLRKKDRLVYMYGDGAPKEMADRIEGVYPKDSWVAEYGERVHFTQYAMKVSEYPEFEIGQVLEFLSPAKRGIVVVDTVTSYGGGHNDDEKYNAWHEVYVRPFLNAGHSVVLLDHRPKDKHNVSQRGSEAKRDSIRFRYLVEMVSQDDDSIVSYLTVDKNNNNIVKVNTRFQMNVYFGETPHEIVIHQVEDAGKESADNPQYRETIDMFRVFGFHQGYVGENADYQTMLNMTPARAQSVLFEATKMGILKPIPEMGKAPKYEVVPDLRSYEERAEKLDRKLKK